MLNLKMENIDVIDESIYRKDISLKQEISNALRKNDKLSDEDIINIVVKYFIVYIFPNKLDNNINIEEINKIFSIVNFIFTISRFHWNSIRGVEPVDINLLDFILKNWYSLSMLWDIAATVELFKEIVNKEISPLKFNNEYLWLDLWTWSWILLLAQYLQAHRNWFECISNYWIEVSISSFRTRLLTEKILFWEIKKWDTTKQETYNFIKYSDSEITHISNETIPTVWISFWHHLINKTPHNPDPFIENNKALFNACRWNISEATIFFPEKIRVVLSTNPKDILDNTNHKIIDKNNNFWIETFNELEGNIKNVQWNNSFILSPYVFPTWIEIWWKIIRQDMIWERVIKKWMVKKLKDWRSRWDTINWP